MNAFMRDWGWPVTCGVLLALVLLQYYPEPLGMPASAPNLSVAPTPDIKGNGQSSYRLAVQRAAPAVANVYTTRRTTDVTGAPLLRNPATGDYNGALPPPAQRDTSLGSAVILSPDGYLLTNNHVIAGAEQILVALRDGREAMAELVGTDPETDLAVLKVELDNLPSVSISSAEQQAIGDVVLAIGNPFGLGQTVTMGIVSATGRNQLGLNTYEDFIQTDAAINQGNSGGALIDTAGNLIGINTAIFSQSGGSQGIGFAIPVQLATEVMQAIIEHGRVVRGWLGVEVQPLTADLAEAFQVAPGSGLVISGLYREGPAWQAGLKPGDVILRIDGETAVAGRQAMNQVARARPGDTVTIEVLRDGKLLSVEAAVGVRPNFKR
ncbi:S1C family serine protease [Halopseudomonas sp.]|jgi:serine protease DegS|uniref:S1C family serine protease n=1 Tax=Halopseudomonas sp. TaxID=2901191 RepID=UPI001A3C469C|nr:trypsin-like peptidase domain-containing protein [Pseudomonas sp.]